MTRRFAFPALLLFLLSQVVHAIPPGYRYVGSRVVSEGRHVYWYWNADHYQPDASGAGFVANMYARNLELNQERAFVAIVRCDSKTYRRADSGDPFDAIQEGDPVYEVWRAGCDGSRAATLAVRMARMDGTAPVAAQAPAPPRVAAPAAIANASPAPPATGGSPPSASTATGRGDDRRADSCIRFAEKSVSQFGDATITNTCKFDVEVAYCYKGGRGGAYDCPSPARMRRVDSLPPGATRNLPEYRRGKNTGVALAACRGTLATVTPQLGGEGTVCR